MHRLLVATRNQGKVREIARALEAAGIDAIGLDSPDFKGDDFDPDETGETFEANARIKAEAWSQKTDLPVLADDSGLEVDALSGAPGVRSARYGGPRLDDDGRNARLLQALADTPDDERSARFRCVLALARNGQTLATFDGVVDGTIVRRPKGKNGFGYDPIFFHEPSGCTTAELSTEAKQQISHRGEALRKLAARIGDLLD